MALKTCKNSSLNAGVAGNCWTRIIFRAAAIDSNVLPWILKLVLFQPSYSISSNLNSLANARNQNYSWQGNSQAGHFSVNISKIFRAINFSGVCLAKGTSIESGVWSKNEDIQVLSVESNFHITSECLHTCCCFEIGLEAHLRLLKRLNARSRICDCEARKSLQRSENRKLPHLTQSEITLDV